MKKFVFSLSFVFLLSNNLFSQQTVEEVIVTATKTEKTKDKEKINFFIGYPYVYDY